MAALLSLQVICAEVRATGIESSLRWIQQSEQPPVLQAPEFFFEHEVRRLARELHPKSTAKPPVKEGESAKERSERTAKCDLRDFHEAVETKRIAPPDIAAAEEAHRAVRELIDRPESTEAPPKEFPSEFADYHSGALAYSRGKKDEAAAAWKALLERPKNERHYRTTWATYMLGKLAIEAEDWNGARQRLAETRQAAKDGFADSLDLVTSSLGWEAYADLHSGRLTDAARLYLAQLSAGDDSAINSLRVVLQEAFKEDSDLASLAKDPVMQRLGIAGAVADISPFQGFYGEASKEDLTARWLRAIEAIDAKNVRDADRLGWIAYTRGEYDRAQRWLDRAPADDPYALWLKAKLILREGDVKGATQLISRAVAKIPQLPRVTAYSIENSDIPPYDVSRGDLALLRLSNGEFLSALRLFLDGGLYSDAYYLADGVLTLDELKNFVEREAPKLPKPPEDDTGEAPWHYYFAADAEAELRGILARRLVRAGRYAEARPWFTEEAQGWLDEYISHLQKANNPKVAKAERADAFWKAALLMREHGDALSDYFDPVTMAQRSSGRTIKETSWPDISLKLGEPDNFVPPLSKAEQERLKKHAIPTLRRYYSLYLAADLGWKSAALMPDNDESTATRLNTIGSWLKNRDEAAADRFYQAIEHRCARTKLGKEAIKRHWFVPEEESEPEQ